MDFDRAQMQMLRAIANKGWPVDLLSHLLSRCGASQQQWDSLISSNAVEVVNDRFVMTRTGKRVYNLCKKSMWFKESDMSNATETPDITQQPQKPTKAKKSSSKKPSKAKKSPTAKSKTPTKPVKKEGVDVFGCRLGSRA